ncbi:MAG: hypothetical protein ACRCVT_01715 [Leadbetterella sp.]
MKNLIFVFLFLNINVSIYANSKVIYFKELVNRYSSTNLNEIIVKTNWDIEYELSNDKSNVTEVSYSDILKANTTSGEISINDSTLNHSKIFRSNKKKYKGFQNNHKNRNNDNCETTGDLNDQLIINPIVPKEISERNSKIIHVGVTVLVCTCVMIYFLYFKEYE